ncbi:Rad17 cell cycle checkpoint protein-domain-containing protein [Aspergillus pseudoustus]|uniref:Rad17 cell cycle checkpoint protein-domain-containing protein n=1 Tax=Aspergillus pseudoustus TaxID=1810923 RepID=A0ABR4JJZ2_9EURO
MQNNHQARLPNDLFAHEPSRNLIGLDETKPRWPSSEAVATGSPGSASEDMDDSEDLIEDDYDSYDELFTQHFTNDDISLLEGVGATSTTRSTQSQQVQKPPKRFLLPSKSSPKTGSSNSLKSNKEDLPWTQRFFPTNLEELAVHKRKVRDVEQWLNDALAGRPQRGMLVLKGPAGSGKSTTVTLLAHKLRFNILEWKSPAPPEYAAKGYVSLGAQFDDFLSRGHSFGSLDLDGTNGSQSPTRDLTLPNERRIILIEEFPTLTGRNSSILAAFRVSLLRRLVVHASHTTQSRDREAGAKIPPIIMVVSETLSNTDSSFDNLTVHRLLGREICNHPSTRIIEFNSIAPTIMYKALDLVVKKSAHDAKPLASTLEGLSRTGDIRNAVASLEFVCLGAGSQRYQGYWTSKTKNSSRVRKAAQMAINGEPEMVSQRESSLGLFHAVGKIVHNKRNERPDIKQLPLPSAPNHLRHRNRPDISQVNVNGLLEEIGTDVQSFISALHENYVASCNGPSFTETLENCIGALSDSDLLCTDWKGVNRSQAGFGVGFLKPGAGVDSLRQEELSYHVAARGLLFSLPFPVNRQSHPTDKPRGGSISQKLSFPPVYRLQRHMEEVQGALDQCIDTLLASSVRPTAVPMGCLGRADDRSEENASTAMTVLSRNDLLLYQLPFMSMILRDGAKAESLGRITALPTLQDRNPGFSSQADQSPTWESISRSKRAPGAHLGLGAQDEQLILSDDDIVDDSP